METEAGIDNELQGENKLPGMTGLTESLFHTLQDQYLKLKQVLKQGNDEAGGTDVSNEARILFQALISNLDFTIHFGNIDVESRLRLIGIKLFVSTEEAKFLAKNGNEAEAISILMGAIGNADLDKTTNPELILVALRAANVFAALLIKHYTSSSLERAVSVLKMALQGYSLAEVCGSTGNCLSGERLLAEVSEAEGETLGAAEQQQKPPSVACQEEANTALLLLGLAYGRMGMPELYERCVHESLRAQLDWANVERHQWAAIAMSLAAKLVHRGKLREARRHICAAWFMLDEEVDTTEDRPLIPTLWKDRLGRWLLQLSDVLVLYGLALFACSTPDWPLEGLNQQRCPGVGHNSPVADPRLLAVTDNPAYLDDIVVTDADMISHGLTLPRAEGKKKDKTNRTVIHFSSAAELKSTDLVIPVDEPVYIDDFVIPVELPDMHQNVSNKAKQVSTTNKVDGVAEASAANSLCETCSFAKKLRDENREADSVWEEGNHSNGERETASVEKVVKTVDGLSSCICCGENGEGDEENCRCAEAVLERFEESRKSLEARLDEISFGEGSPDIATDVPAIGAKEVARMLLNRSGHGDSAFPEEVTVATWHAEVEPPSPQLMKNLVRSGGDGDIGNGLSDNMSKGEAATVGEAGDGELSPRHEPNEISEDFDKETKDEAAAAVTTADEDAADGEENGEETGDQLTAAGVRMDRGSEEDVDVGSVPPLSDDGDDLWEDVSSGKDDGFGPDDGCESEMLLEQLQLGPWETLVPAPPLRTPRDAKRLLEFTLSWLEYRQTEMQGVDEDLRLLDEGEVLRQAARFEPDQWARKNLLETAVVGLQGAVKLSSSGPTQLRALCSLAQAQLQLLAEGGRQQLAADCDPSLTLQRLGQGLGDMKNDRPLLPQEVLDRVLPLR